MTTTTRIPAAFESDTERGRGRTFTAMLRERLARGDDLGSALRNAVRAFANEGNMRVLAGDLGVNVSTLSQALGGEPKYHGVRRQVEAYLGLPLYALDPEGTDPR